MTKYLTRKLLALCVLLAPVTGLAEYAINPIKPVIKGNQRITSMKFQSNEPKAKTFQVSVYEKSEDGSYKVSKKVLATPRIFRTKEGANTQTIRVLAKNKDENAQFKLSIREVQPVMVEGEGANIHMIPDFRLPLTVEK